MLLLLIIFMAGFIGPKILFFVSPVKTRKDFSLFYSNCLNVRYPSFGEQK